MVIFPSCVLFVIVFVLSVSLLHEKAKKLNTVEAYKKYIERFPSGNYYLIARNRIKQLEAKAFRESQKEILSKIRQRRRVRLRSQFKQGKEESLESGISKGRRARNIFEKTEINGDKVIIDYNTGLMWHLWKRPMEFDKAKLWGIRRYAGFNNWRLPTTEELASVLNLDIKYFTNIPDGKCEIWTGDAGVHETTRTYWVMEIPSGKITQVIYDQTKYLCTVLSVK